MTEARATRKRIGCDASGVPLAGSIDGQRHFHLRFDASEEDIDELGHVNNTTWVAWIQDASVAHWFAAARPGDADTFVAVVLRHEVDYRGNIKAGESATAATWVEGRPRGARYARRVEFTDVKGRLLVESLSQWALLEKATGRLVRVPAEVAAPFLTDGHEAQGSRDD
ncbi:MAG TPA: thioesterase [Sphingobium sp.]|uniref:acyl-CoA thioesterase n=1 Tax=Sphingobium sp. TaxID=1912891 RepID=UPI000EC088DC|nr:acyl-CoA thioesterase [Sphingobium sp.]HAF42728.1 thioesterase [Sphingobium sp.]